MIPSSEKTFRKSFSGKSSKTSFTSRPWFQPVCIVYGHLDVQIKNIILFRFLPSPELSISSAEFCTPSATQAASPRSACPQLSSRWSEGCSHCCSAHFRQPQERSVVGEERLLSYLDMMELQFLLKIKPQFVKSSAVYFNYDRIE